MNINGKFRNYASVRINVFGRTLVGMQNISYSRTDDINPVKAVGTTKPIGYTQGNEVYEGSITLLTEEVDGMQKILPPGKSLPDIPPFPVSVAYVDDAGVQVAHTLIGVKFKSNGRSAEQGNADALTTEIPLYIHDIDWNA